jgi:hypothetical protein
MLSTAFEKLLSFISSRVYSASSLSSTLSDELNNDELQKIKDSNQFVNWIIRVSIPLGITCAFLLLVYAGYMMVTSQGNPDKLQESREVITNTIIGFVVIFVLIVGLKIAMPILQDWVSTQIS